jgi:hypothetical protein
MEAGVMTQKEACHDPIIQQLAEAIRRDPHDRLADRAFDDRCEELGVRFGNRFFRSLFVIMCRPEVVAHADDPPSPFDDLPF